MVTLVAVLSLALAVAANAAMFSILNSFLLEPFPYEDQDQLVMFRTLPRGAEMDMAGGVSVPNFRDYVAASQSIERSTIYRIEPANLTGLDVPEQLSVIVASPSIFDVLGVQPAVGRGFRPEEAFHSLSLAGFQFRSLRTGELGVSGTFYRLLLPMGPPFICTIGHVDSPPPDYQKGVTATVSGSLKAHS